MEKIQEIDFTKIVAIVTVLSSAISIIITKIFENYQNSIKHKRIIKEKIIETKLDACKTSIKYYGTFLNYLYASKNTIENLENYNYSMLISESGKLHEELLKKIQFENGGDFHQILLFYDFYTEDDEEIADKLKNSNREYFEFINNPVNSGELEKEKEFRQKLITTIDEAIQYFKTKIKVVRDDLNKTME